MDRKSDVGKPVLSWLEVSAIVFILDRLKDRKLTKLGLTTPKVEALRHAQKRLTEALEAYIENGK